MPMENFQKFALTLAIAVLGIWGVLLILLPDQILVFFSEEQINHATTGMMGAALLGLAFISFASITQWIGARRALGIAMLILLVESAYLMLGAGTMLVTGPTSISLVVAATVAFFLLI
uniref:Uncharacterized protein n=2 Tax=unclassified Candidatus Kentrum TaxID=2643149 RepID=A0A451A7M2_9GAMM|nr:MAG: hypothetical protein BECKLPF1236A_GA0070988_1001017 [Candidatus Kentron sp. LPFa]VFK23801.1 MAG: hypothetical protein BECKLPF1236C_GA0070990_100082 [Candidatus Kentron sp. LPFa]VFK62021.1 MAG: hypothetical protein BECKUNK1418G_GA0071005_102113 [Candidatus Kentron sp. UNK]VFK70342.1 MAG: hypothetical protein BECKUNK1418H_GA0071006_102713 [Candidatus Kentron sp. UNK]